jgi:hypothetical protein
MSDEGEDTFEDADKVEDQKDDSGAGGILRSIFFPSAIGLTSPSAPTLKEHALRDPTPKGTSGPWSPSYVASTSTTTTPNMPKITSNYFESPIVDEFTDSVTLEKSFPERFFHKKPDWADVRWIDIEGLNGDIIQFLLRTVDCERQLPFNNIVDPKQRISGLLLSEVDAECIEFLMVSKVPSLTLEALNRQEDIVERKQLFNIEKDIMEFEKISYLLCTGGEKNKLSGTLISFQEGKSGDVFQEVREMIQDELLIGRGASHLLMVRSHIYG